MSLQIQTNDYNDKKETKKVFVKAETPLNLSLVGYGKMGHAIERVALSRGHSIASRISKSDPDAHFQTIFPGSVERADVAIEFSHPTMVLEHVKDLAKLKKPIVIGTTGWNDSLDTVKELAEKENIGIVYSPNFSLGVNLFCKLTEWVGKIMNFFPQYDVAGSEWHHREKADNPSGTAKKLANILIETVDRKKKTLFESPDRRLLEEELMFTGVRCGAIPGMHEIRFDSHEDTLILRMESRSRDGYALGAVNAAEWIQNKKGFFSFDDVINEMIKDKL